MSSYYYNFDPEKAFELIKNNAVHFHISVLTDLMQGKDLNI